MILMEKVLLNDYETINNNYIMERTNDNWKGYRLFFKTELKLL